MKKIFLLLISLAICSNACAGKLISDLPNDSSGGTTDDMIETLDSPGGTPASKHVTLGALFAGTAANSLIGWTKSGTVIYPTSTSDNVAIGQTSASYKLDVNGTAHASAFVGDGSGLTNLGVTANGWVDGGTNVYQQTTTDVVGIGTTTPTGKLDIRGDEVRVWTGSGTDTNATSSGELYVEGDLEADGTIYGDSPQFTTSTISPKIIGGSGSTQTLTLQTTSGAGAAGADMKFVVGNNGGTEAMRILNSGNIGVGTINPLKPFEVVSPNVNGFRSLYTGASGAFNSARIIAATNDGSAMGTGEKLGELLTGGFDGTAMYEGGGLYCKTTGTMSSSDHGTNCYLDTTPPGSTTRAAEFMVDGNGRVGFNTTSPSSQISVVKLNTYPYLGISSGVGQLNDIMLVDSSGNVGIGTYKSTSLLQVKGGDLKVGTGTFNNASSSDDLYVTGNLEVDGTLYGDGSGLTNVSGSGGNSGWTDGGTNVYETTTNDFVGIGTTTPSTTLEIVKQGSTTPLMISSVFTGDGDFLIVRSNGNVGIGSVSPGALVDVQGTMRFQSGVGLGTTAGQMIFYENSSNGSNFVGFTAPASRSSDSLYTLPSADGTSGQVLQTNGSNVLSWVDQSGGGSSAAGWTDGGTNVYQTTTTDVIGIGTTTPASATTVEIVKQSSNALLRISSTATGNGDYLVVKSSGNVGIGTIEPTAMLSVGGSGDQFLPGNVGIGTTDAKARFIVSPPAIETIAAGATITADACGTIKRINATGAQTTNTTNTFTAPTPGYNGCCMRVINVDTADAITLDNNANFKSAGAADVVLGITDTVEVCSDGVVWYQLGATGNN